MIYCVSNEKSPHKTALAVAVAAALGVSASAGAALEKQNAAVNSPLPAGMTFPLLLDQTNNASGNGAPDQDFEPAYDIYDAEGADDFVVTDPAGWTIQGVMTPGTQSAMGTAASVDIIFYSDSGGLPGTPVAGCSFPGVVPVETAGSFEITLPGGGCFLPGGGITYWMSQQTNQDFATSAQHFWGNRSVTSGNPGVWRNPGDGFATGCTDWTNQMTCGVGGGASSDWLFALGGVIGPVSQLPPPPSVPALNSWGLIGLGLLLLGGAGLALRRRMI